MDVAELSTAHTPGIAHCEKSLPKTLSITVGVHRVLAKYLINQLKDSNEIKYR